MARRKSGGPRRWVLSRCDKTSPRRAGGPNVRPVCNRQMRLTHFHDAGTCQSRSHFAASASCKLAARCFPSVPCASREPIHLAVVRRIQLHPKPGEACLFFGTNPISLDNGDVGLAAHHSFHCFDQPDFFTFRILNLHAPHYFWRHRIVSKELCFSTLAQRGDRFLQLWGHVCLFNFFRLRSDQHAAHKKGGEDCFEWCLGFHAFQNQHRRRGTVAPFSVPRVASKSASRQTAVGVWSLEFIWRLGFEVWSLLVTPSTPAPPLSSPSPSRCACPR